MGGAVREVEAVLAELCQPAPYARLLAKYIRDFRNLSREEVKDGVNETICKVLEFFGDGDAPSLARHQVERYLHTCIRNTLVSAFRASRAARFVDLDAGLAELDLADAPKRPGAVPLRDAGAESGSRPVPPPPRDGIRNLEDVLVEQIDRDDLMRDILARLPPRYRDVVVHLLGEWSPQELAGTFGGDGYRLRHWARVLVCRILGELAAGGHALAASLHAGGDCARLLAAEAP